jgi:hypothetical protein
MADAGELPYIQQINTVGAMLRLSPRGTSHAVPGGVSEAKAVQRGLNLQASAIRVCAMPLFG